MGYYKEILFNPTETEKNSTNVTRRIEGGDLPRHVYQALPTGKEWEPFLDLIKTLASGEVSLSSDSLEALKGLKEPHLIQVLITPSCPFCARMVSLVNRLAAASPLVTAWIIDVELFPEWVRRVSLKSVPTTILEEEIVFTGSVKEEDLIGWLGKMGSPDYLKELYRNDLLEKRMARTVERLKKRPQDLPIMADLLKAEEFGIKLGAMAVIEQLVNEAPRLHGVIFEALSPLLQETADLLVGDVIYLLGLLHDPRKVPALGKFSCSFQSRSRRRRPGGTGLRLNLFFYQDDFKKAAESGRFLMDDLEGSGFKYRTQLAIDVGGDQVGKKIKNHPHPGGLSVIGKELIKDGRTSSFLQYPLHFLNAANRVGDDGQNEVEDDGIKRFRITLKVLPVHHFRPNLHS